MSDEPLREFFDEHENVNLIRMGKLLKLNAFIFEMVAVRLIPYALKLLETQFKDYDGVVIKINRNRNVIKFIPVKIENGVAMCPNVAKKRHFRVKNVYKRWMRFPIRFILLVTRDSMCKIFRTVEVRGRKRIFKDETFVMSVPDMQAKLLGWASSLRAAGDRVIRRCGITIDYGDEVVNS